MSKLFLVPTPIGNLKDITFRAIEILKDADVILAEDTRKSGILLKHYDIKTRMQAYHKFNEHTKTPEITENILAGSNYALITDAGTPGISDPGFFLVRACLEKEIQVETLPGATAFVPALVNSGFPCDKFVFEGFLPQKKGRLKRLKELANETRTIIFYESPHRLKKFLEQSAEVFGEERRLSVSREISKLHEENIRDSVKNILLYFSEGKIKGEIVIIVEGKEKSK